MKISLKDARQHGVRGNVDLGKLEIPRAPVPKPSLQELLVPTVEAIKENSRNIEAALKPILDAMTTASSRVVQPTVLVSTPPSPPAAPVYTPKHWTFVVTERNDKGEIVSFTASPRE